jgi:NAD(P)-dependent dehydrogenase (short-subunit alcohol dehydrogenase family)
MTKRTFLITGASKGIGLATAHWLSSRGHSVIGAARSKTGVDFPGEYFSIDFSDSAITCEWIKALNAKYKIDGVVNNVGNINAGPLEEVTTKDLFEVLDLTLRPTLEITRALVPGMKASGWGRIINMSSRGILGIPNRTSYASAKAAMMSFTRTWSLELASYNITVNCVAPGPIESDLFRQNSPVGSPSEARVLSMIPMGKIGKPEDVASAIGFLASEEASFITGQTIFIDGGASIGKVAV